MNPDKPARPAIAHRRACQCMGCRMARGHRDPASIQRGGEPFDLFAPVDRDPKVACRVIWISLAGFAIGLAALRWLT